MAALVLPAVACNAPETGGNRGAEGADTQENAAEEQRAVSIPKEVNAEQAQAFLAEHPEALIVDVRNPPEWDGELGHIEGARLIPLPELADRLEEIADWKHEPVLLVCRSGNRSGRARQMLRDAGFEQPINLSGGMIGWRRAGY